MRANLRAMVLLGRRTAPLPRLRSWPKWFASASRATACGEFESSSAIYAALANTAAGQGCNNAALVARFVFTSAGCGQANVLQLTRKIVNGPRTKTSGVDVRVQYDFDNFFGLDFYDTRVSVGAEARRAEDLGYDPSIPRSSWHPGNVWSLHGYHECLVRLGKAARMAEQLDDAAPVRVRQAAGEVDVRGVERDADRHRLAVAQLVVRELLELVRGPVPEVERARRAQLEGVARRGRSDQEAEGLVLRATKLHGYSRGTRKVSADEAGPQGPGGESPFR